MVPMKGFPPLVDVERENFVGDDQTSKGFSLFSDQIGRAEKKESIDLLHERLEIFQIPISLERTRQGRAGLSGATSLTEILQSVRNAIKCVIWETI